uniref:Integrase core domain containing protein n=1 Tax=Solanum tuberosum TaxID=4113 RepID=M1DPD3_SOLTU
MFSTFGGEKGKICRKTVVQWSTDPIDGPWVHPRTMNGVRRTQETKILDIDLIWDEANVVAPRTEPHVEVPPLGDDLVADEE